MSTALLRTFVLREPAHAQSLWAFLKANAAAFAHQGKPLAVSVTEHKAKRNGDQNRYMWNRLAQIADCAWVGGKQFSQEAWHEYFKGKFIGYEETPDGRLIGISTTTLGVGEFAEYVTKIEQHAAQELGVEFH